VSAPPNSQTASNLINAQLSFYSLPVYYYLLFSETTLGL
jgi:hypothetical protein